MIQVVRFKCCGTIFAACVEPDCYEDPEWLEHTRQYASHGHKVELIQSGALVFNKCECSEDTKATYRIKPLQWLEGIPMYKIQYICHASNGLRDYVIYAFKGDPNKFALTNNGQGLGEFDTLEEAKQAAQADYHEFMLKHFLELV